MRIRWAMAAVMLVGCGEPTFEDHCRKLERCLGEDVAPADQCLAGLEAQQVTMVDVECEAEWLAFSACGNKASTCDNSGDAPTYGWEPGDCDAELEVLNTCL